MKIYQKLTFITSSVALFVVAGVNSASADTFNFSYSSPSDTASGVLTTNPYNSATNSYLITEITGARDGVSIDSLLPSDSFAGNDNLLLASTSKLDINGFSYIAGGKYFGVYFGGDYYHEVTPSVDQIVAFSATAVPEPSSVLGVLGLGVLTGSTLLKRKLKKT